MEETASKEEIVTYFFDTYALFEIIHKNESYLPYIKEINIITTKLNLLELHYRMLSLYGEEKADLAFERFKEYCVNFTDIIIKEANKFRAKNYRRDLSYIDCISYILAKKHGVKFLTGDEQFQNFEGVEFVR